MKLYCLKEREEEMATAVGEWLQASVMFERKARQDIAL